MRRHCCSRPVTVAALRAGERRHLLDRVVRARVAQGEGPEEQAEDRGEIEKKKEESQKFESRDGRNLLH